MDTPRTADRSTEQNPDRPSWTARQAARYCSVSKSTILRALNSGKLPNAKRENGAWKIPIDDLLAAGFRPDRIGGPQVGQDRSVDRSAATEGGPQVDQELIDLREQLREEQTRRQLAEQALEHAQERAKMLAQNLDDVRATVRILEAAPPRHQPHRDADLVDLPIFKNGSVTLDSPKKRRWWRRS